MNKKRFQQVNRAAVASVLAASGAIAALPVQNVKANSPFTDVPSDYFAYDAIVNLYERNIISGYGNGRFGPHDSVTRGQAAKMLAQVLELDTRNVVNPQFKDLSMSDPFYKYIAALANAGVITGFVDSTYRSNEPITRGQMAIILTRGFQFKQASKLTHTFDDVTVNTYERFFIQTIYELGITKGKSERSFEPYAKVTRGEMAVFINRAENVQAMANPVYEVTDVHTVGNITYAYVNGVKHTVDSSLKNIINDSNAAALEGALIEGRILDTKRILSLSKITFTAKGSAGRSLQFNGLNSVFSGDVAITGSYLKIRNWTVTGEVSIEPETVRTIRAAIEASPFKRVASLGSPFGFIDWGQETDPDDYEPIGSPGGNGDPWTGPADGSEDGSDLVSPPIIGESGYFKKMTPVYRYIEFIDSDIRYLVIRQSGTHVTSTKTLPYVTVTGNVKAYELYADVKTMYIETDVNTTMYGISTIDEVYKNSYKSVNLDADTTIDLMIVDNSNGWIDLGDHTYIDKVIIPPKKMPNDIFNDFINDNDLIGNIEDPSGGKVDRDPIENTIVPDLEDPELKITNIETNLDTAKVTFNSNEDGTLYYIVKKEKDGEPSIREIMQNTGSRWAGRTNVSEGIDKVVEITDLDEETDYIIYAVVVDEAGNISDKIFDFFEIKDASAPIIKDFKAEGLPGGTRIKVEFNPNEAGEYYYYYLDAAYAPTEPVTTKMLVETLSKRPNGGGSGKVTTPGLNSFTLTGLQPETEYVIYLVMKDEAGNFMAAPLDTKAETHVLDITPPQVVGNELKRVGETYEFYFDVTKELDPVTANDPNNYDLFGTAILNVEGQPVTIKPEYVNYVPGSKRVTIRIPSATALVNGDTIEIHVLPGVKDLADNAFSNINNEPSPEVVKNSAKYIHKDTLDPKVVNEKIEFSPDRKTGYLQFDSNKAGTFYYMIVADDFDWTGIDNDDFYEDFVKEPNPGLFPLGVNTVLSKFGDERNNSVVVGTQDRISVDIPQTVNPFKSYSLHLIVKDRSGRLSNKVEIPLINDKKAPFISSLQVLPEEGSNTSVDLKIASSEAGKIYYKRVQKKILDPVNNTEVDNPELLNLKAIIDNQKTTLKANDGNLRAGTDLITQTAVAEIDTWTKVDLRKGLTEYTHSGLLPHEEYVYYFAVEDIAGNLTLFEENKPSTAPQTYNNEFLIREVYTDGIAPTIEPIFKKALQSEFEDDNRNTVVKWGTSNIIGDGVIEYVPEKTFKATFSEALTINTNSNTGIPLQQDDKAVLEELKEHIENQLNNTTVITDIEWQKTDSIGTHEERQLVVTFNGEVTTDITIDMTKLVDANGSMIVTDLADRTFKKDETLLLTPDSFAEYKVPTQTNNIIKSAYFDVSDFIPTGDGVTYSSKFLRTQVEVGTQSSWNQTLYYVATNSSKDTLTDSEVDQIIKSLSTNRKVFLTEIPIYGKEVIDAPSKLYVLKVRDMPGYQETDYFHTKQNLFIFTVDQYGNIVWAYDEVDTSKLYRTIKYTP